uniref:Uncharacterized protein n=1 Tax=viral metagenome TaxID=1070528 RepID=A0A6C0BKV9_9ZZZZ
MIDSSYGSIDRLIDTLPDHTLMHSMYSSQVNDRCTTCVRMCDVGYRIVHVDYIREIIDYDGCKDHLDH